MLPWAPAASAPVEFRGNHHAPAVEVRVNGQPVNGQPARALIQSSTNATVMTRRLADKLGVTKPGAATGREVRSHGTDPRVSRGQVFRVDELVVGQEVLRGVPVIVTENGTGAPDEMVLGQDWLRHRKVWLSFGSRRVFLAPVGGG